MNKFNKIRIVEFIRFAVVGIIATIIHYGTYFIFVKLNIQTIIAYSIGYLISLIFNFYFTIVFTFKTKTTLKKGLGFGVSHLVNYFLHIIFLNLYLYVGFSKTLAPFPVYATVVPINFLLLRYFFKNDETI